MRTGRSQKNSHKKIKMPKKNSISTISSQKIQTFLVLKFVARKKMHPKTVLNNKKSTVRGTGEMEY